MITSHQSIVNSQKSGVAALPLILLISAILIELSIGGAVLAFYLTNSGTDLRLSQEVLVAARSGVQDGILRVIRDKDASNAGGYAMTVGGRTVTVTIVKSQPASGQTTITASSSALTRQKKVQAVVSVDATTGEVNLLSFDEISI